MLADLTLVLGGAASGKSTLAERLIAASGQAPVYIATAQARDGEMEAKIARHKARRGPEWRNIEEPLDLPGALAGVKAGDVVLVDCATLWLSNLMGAGRDLVDAEAGLVSALATCPAPVIVVSNEVGLGIVPDNAAARAFREAQGRLNQSLAGQAGLVVFVAAGLPMLMKGTLPEGVA